MSAKKQAFNLRLRRFRTTAFPTFLLMEKPTRKDSVRFSYQYSTSFPVATDRPRWKTRRKSLFTFKRYADFNKNALSARTNLTIRKYQKRPRCVAFTLTRSFFLYCGVKRGPYVRSSSSSADGSRALFCAFFY
jgi:hypothetical protein